MIDFFPAVVLGFVIAFFVYLLVLGRFEDRKIYKVSVYTLGGTLLGCVNVKAFDPNSAIKKGYKFITKHCGFHSYVLFPSVEEVGKIDKCI